MNSGKIKNIDELKKQKKNKYNKNDKSKEYSGKKNRLKGFFANIVEDAEEDYEFQSSSDSFKQQNRKPESSKDEGLSKRTIKAAVFLIIFLVLVVAFLIIKIKFEITSVEVVGNDHYTKEEIENMVISDDFERNSIFLYIKGLYRKDENIPFIEAWDINILSPNSVRIEVYEKSIGGYISYLDHYMYFDKDGIVVESSTEATEGIPYVTGLKFDHVVLHEKLPTENDSVFKLILNITQLLTKYEISIDRIYFDKDLNITLYLGNVRVMLGDSNYIDEKINKLRFLIPRLPGNAGELHMENFTPESEIFTFESDKIETDESTDKNESESGENSIKTVDFAP